MSVATLDSVRSTVRPQMTVPGIGYAIREQNRYVLDDPAINAVEITFERADDPLRVDRYIGEQDFDHVSVHALKLSVASPDAPGRNYLMPSKRSQKRTERNRSAIIWGSRATATTVSRWVISLRRHSRCRRST